MLPLPLNDGSVFYDNLKNANIDGLVSGLRDWKKVENTERRGAARERGGRGGSRRQGRETG